MCGSSSPAHVTIFDVGCESSFTPLAPNCCVAVDKLDPAHSVEGRNPRILGQNISQGPLERIEPRLIMTPVVHRLAKNRLAHLLGACGTHGAVILVEAQASHVE